MKRMKRMILPLVLTVALAVPFVHPGEGQAASELDKINQQLNDLDRQRKEADRKAADAKEAIQKIQSDKKTVKNDIVTLQGEIDKVGNELDKLNTQVAQVKDDLEEAGNQLVEAESRVESRDQMLKSRVKMMYTNGTVSYLEVLFSSTSFSDFLDRYQSLKLIVGQDKRILEANKKDRNLIVEKKKQVERQLAEVKDLYAKTQQIRNDLIAKEKKKEVLIASLNQQELVMEEVTDDQDKLLQDIASKRTDLLAKKDKLKIQNYYKGGKLAWPVPDSNRITSGFGSRTDPVTGELNVSHAGIDIGAPNGTEIVAAESGVVVVAEWYGGYGNCVIIDHGNGLRTLYGHIRPNGIKVSVGDTVKRGQKIAEVGSTGKSTGNHCHFGVYVNGVAVEPTKYLK